MRFDEVFEYLGDFGPYQMIVYFAVSFSSAFTVLHKMAWVFIGAVPKHRCFLDVDATARNAGGISYQLPERILNASIPWNPELQERNSCEKYVEINGASVIRKETCDEWVYDTSQYTYTLASEFDLVCQSNLMLTLLLTLWFVGEALGSIFISVLSDRIGRKKSLIICLGSQGIVGILSAFIQNYYVYAFSRIVLAAFTQGIYLVSFVLAMEFVGTPKRVFAGTAFNYFFAIGYLVEAGLAYLIRDWRFLQMAMSIPPLLYTVVIIFVPESARWLIATNRFEDAMKIIETAAKYNKKSLPEINLKIEEDSSTDTMTLKEVLKIPSIIFKVIILCYVWFAIDAVYLGLSLNTSNIGVGNAYINFLIAALLEFPGYTVSIFFTYYCGRRIPLCFSLLLSGSALIGSIFVPREMGAVIITLVMTGKFGTTIAFSVIFVYAIELYPTQVRNGALGLNSTCARIGGLLSSFIMLLKSYWAPFPWVLLGGIAISSGLLTLLLPETNKKDLPENFTDASKTMQKKKEKK